MRNPGAKASCRGLQHKILVVKNVTLFLGPIVHFEESQLGK